MNRILLVITVFSILTGCKKDAQYSPIPAIPCDLQEGSNTFSKKDTLGKLAQEYAKMGIPGLVIAVYTPAGGYWGTAGGFSET